MQLAELDSHIENLKKYIENERFKGYDPYDTLNSFLPLTLLGKFPAAVAIQLQKRNPINIRPLLGIKKGYNPKAIGLLLETYCLLYKQKKDESLKKNADFLFKWLTSNYSKGFSGMCWGYNFGWANPAKYLPPYSPTVVVSGFIARAIYTYWQVFKTENAKEVLISIADFVETDIPVTETKRGICYSYSTKMKECCYNASLLAAEILLYAHRVKDNDAYVENAKKANDFVVSKQHKDGHWNYSIDIQTGVERVQIDFHQGYILDSIQSFIDIAKPKENKYQNAIQNGLKYFRTQFFENGRSKWRIPKEYPTDIHNQAQGIITFAKFSDINSSYLDFADSIATWTINNMQSNTGFFYYRKYPTHTNKIPFMRWSQAWMLLALIKLASKK